MTTRLLRNLLVTVLVAAGFACQASAALARTWTDNTGRHHVEAEFVDASQTHVRLRKGDGSVRSVPLGRLSQADRGYVEQLNRVELDAMASHAGGRPVQKVVVEGVGLTADEALRDAFSNAVRQVVGALVDAETLIRNDQIISDEILTFSEGFVSTYAVLADELRDGLFRRRIVATVERGNLLTRLEARNVVQSGVDGPGLAAEAFTRLEAQRDAAKLLDRYLKDFPASAIVAMPIGQPRLAKQDGGGAITVQRLQLSVDARRFQAMRRRLMNVLEQVSPYQGIVLARSVNVQPRSREDARAYFASRFMQDGSLATRYKQDFQPLFVESRFSSMESVYWTQASGLPSREEEVRRSMEPGTLYVVCTGSGDHVTNWKWFHAAGHPARPGGRLEVETDNLDEAENSVALDRFDLGPRYPGLSIVQERNRGQGLRTLVISPYFLCHEGKGYRAERIVHARRLLLSRQIQVPIEDLARVKSVRCRVTMH